MDYALFDGRFKALRMAILEKVFMKLEAN